MSTNIRPFSNGSQFDDWCFNNCSQCKRSSAETPTPTCQIEIALGLAYIGTEQLNKPEEF